MHATAHLHGPNHETHSDLFEPTPRKMHSRLLSEQLLALRAPIATYPLGAPGANATDAADATGAAASTKKEFMPPDTSYSCLGQTLQFWAARILCVPVFLLLVCSMFYAAVRFLDETFPTLTSVPAAARQIGFSNHAFVHLYFPPSPPPTPPTP